MFLYVNISVFDGSRVNANVTLSRVESEVSNLYEWPLINWNLGSLTLTTELVILGAAFVPNWLTEIVNLLRVSVLTTVKSPL